MKRSGRTCQRRSQCRCHTSRKVIASAPARPRMNERGHEACSVYTSSGSFDAVRDDVSKPNAFAGISSGKSILDFPAAWTI